MAPSPLPSVDRLAATIEGMLPRPLAVEVARRVLAAARLRLCAGSTPDTDTLAKAEAAALARSRPVRVVNATGVLLHTNLGRAPLSAAAAGAAATAATGYGNLEFDLAGGGRGTRGGYATSLLRALTGAGDALALNNNAGALYLALAALGTGGRVVVARGELIEIGGSFRLPDLMTAAGVDLHEVGTTNRTRPADYAAALPGAALMLKVHPSNYRVEGFTEEATYRELAVLGASRGVPFVADVGGGLLDTRCPWLDGPPPPWLGSEPGVRQTLEAGADLVLFSGDKLLGGPQAGIAAGRADLIGRMARHPIARALRVDAPTLAALTVTLEAYADGRGNDIPFWRMAAEPYERLELRARAVVASTGIDAAIVEGESTAGAGTVPGQTIPSPVIRLPGPADRWFGALLEAAVPVVSRRGDGGVFLDLRSVDPDDDAVVVAAVQAAAPGITG